MRTNQKIPSLTKLLPLFFLLIFAILNFILLNWIEFHVLSFAAKFKPIFCCCFNQFWPCCERAEQGRRLNRSACESWNFPGQFLANLFPEKRIFFSGKIWTTLDHFWANFEWMGPIYSKKWPFLRQKSMEANFQQLLGQFLANLLKKKRPFFLGKKRRPILNNFGSIIGQFISKNGHFFKAKKEPNFETFWANFWPISFQKCTFLRPKTWRPILNNFGSIFGQFLSKNGHFLGPKHGGRFWTSLGQFSANLEQFWVNFWPIYAKNWPIIFQAKKEADFEQLWVNFWPILNKWAKKRSIFGQFWINGPKKSQFLANLWKKWPSSFE